MSRIKTKYIGDNVVTDAKLRQGGAASLIGRSANSTGNVADISSSADGQVLQRASGALSFALLVNANIDSAAAIAFSKLATLTSGNILVGSAGNVAASVAMSGEATIIASGAVTLSNAAVIAKVLTAYAAGAGTVSATDSILAAIQKIDGNTAAKLTNPMTTLGDLIYGASAGAATRLAGNTTTAKQFLTQTGNGTISAIPAWGAIANSDLPAPNFYRAGQQAILQTYTFTVTSANATVGATYTNNSQTFTVINTIAAGTTLVCSGTGAPSGSGTLTKATGTGDATITFSTSTNALPTSQVINFSSTLGTTNYAPSIVWKNTTDANPQFQPFEITQKFATGMVVTWNAQVDSLNYVLEYTAFPNV